MAGSSTDTPQSEGDFVLWNQSMEPLRTQRARPSPTEETKENPRAAWSLERLPHPFQEKVVW